MTLYRGFIQIILKGNHKTLCCPCINNFHRDKHTKRGSRKNNCENYRKTHSESGTILVISRDGRKYRPRRSQEGNSVGEMSALSIQCSDWPLAPWCPWSVLSIIPGYIHCELNTK